MNSVKKENGKTWRIIDVINWGVDYFENKSLENPRLEIEIFLDNDGCNILFEDNGPGIPDDLHDQVFFPMVSVKENGSGLGLTIAQDIIRIHGGSITFESKPGETRFAINLPIKINNKEAKIA